MSGKGVEEYYDELEHDERLRLAIEALGREDRADLHRLEETCPTRSYELPHHEFYFAMRAWQVVLLRWQWIWSERFTALQQWRSMHLAYLRLQSDERWDALADQETGPDGVCRLMLEAHVDLLGCHEALDRFCVDRGVDWKRVVGGWLGPTLEVVVAVLESPLEPGLSKCLAPQGSQHAAELVKRRRSATEITTEVLMRVWNSTERGGYV